MIESIGLVVEKAGPAKIENMAGKGFSIEKLGNGPAEVQDVNNFDGAMKEVSRLEGPNKVNGVEGTDGGKHMKVNGLENDNLGNKILDGLEKLRSQSLSQFDKIEIALAKPNPTTTDLMEVQLMVQKWGVEQDLYAKCAGGFDRSIDTLLKAQ